MKKVIRCLLFIVLFFIALGFSESKANGVYTSEDYSYDEYKAKYGNLVLVASYDSDYAQEHIDLLGLDFWIDIGETFTFKPFLINIDTLKEQGYNEAIANQIALDPETIEITGIFNPNLVEYEGDGVFSAVAEGRGSIAFSCEYEGKKYDSAIIVSGIHVGNSMYFSINQNRTRVPGDYINIDNSKMVLDNNNNSDSATVSSDAADQYLDMSDKDPYIFEWSVDDDSIVSIEETETDTLERLKDFVSTIAVTGKKNGATKVRCKVTVSDGEGGTETVEKVIDVTVKGFEEEEEPEEEPTKEEEKKDKGSDDTVANKPLSQTGEKLPIILVAVLAVAGIVYRKLKNHKIK